MSTDLLANNTSDDNTQELKPELLSIEMKSLGEELRDLDCEKNRGEEKDHGVCGSGYHNAWVLGHAER